MRTGVAAQTATALESLGYQLLQAVDQRSNTAHRFVRTGVSVDLVAGTAGREVVDVLISDHPAPKAIQRLRGRDMVGIEGGTQALRRTVNANLQIHPGTVTTVSVPRPFGAVILKAAAYTSDSRDRDRHLFDAAALLACVEDPFDERDDFTGSDRRRVAVLANALSEAHPAWRVLPEPFRTNGQAALRILSTPV